MHRDLQLNHLAWLRLMVCVQEKATVRPVDKSLKIAKELSDLVIYCQPVNFDWDYGRLPFFQFYGTPVVFKCCPLNECYCCTGFL